MPAKRPRRLYIGRDGPDDSAGAGTDLASLGSKKVNAAYALLCPLRSGKPVTLEVDDPRLPKRKRVVKPLLFLVPQTVLGVLSSKVLIAFQTHGCEVVDTAVGVRPLELMRLGLSGRMAKELAIELNRVFAKGEPDGYRA